MVSRRVKLLAATALVIGAGGYFLYSVFAVQGQGVLAQAPLNAQVQVPPGFIMAVDDSGSMTFHNQFPANDGYGCWSRDTTASPWSFFHTSGVNAGQLRATTTSGGICQYSYSYRGPRIAGNFRGIPPLDLLGFARSSDFNPSYFDPTISYQPWLNSDGTPFPQASLTATRIDPRAAATINLATTHTSTNGEDLFYAYTGMVLPAGTQYYVTASCGGLGTTIATRNTWVTLSSNHTMTGNCDVYIAYYPANFYVKWFSDTDPQPELPGVSGAYAAVPRTRISNACGAGCDMWSYQIRLADTAALQNFANWFSFYGNRNRAMVAGMTRAMATVNNMRVGYFTINQNASFDNPVGNAAERVWMRDMALAGDRTALYTSMLALPANGSTPNRQAVYAAGQQFRRTTTDRGGAPVQLMCQKNAVMLFTDGFSNSDGPTVGNLDTGMDIPFRDDHSNTMADIATLYYLNDGSGNSPIRPDLPAGRVPVPAACSTGTPDSKLDCQRNLHVNFYGVTLGGRGNLYDPDNVLDPYTTPAIYNNWPARQNDNRSTVDDIWHGTVNTRGDFISARTPADIVAAMRRVLASVSAGPSPSGSIAQTGARINTASLSVEPEYEVTNEGTDWFSELTASTVSIDPLTRNAVFTEAWKASEEMPLHGSRDVFFARNNGTLRFNATNVTLSDLCNSAAPRTPGMARCAASEVTALGANIGMAINYLLGDTNLEVQNGGLLRDRSTLLGDIVNSTPVVSAPTDDYGYGALSGTPGSTYRTYLNTTKRTRRSMVYAGANDGMLHAFNGGMDVNGVMDGTGGREEFAYIPATALGHMGNLLFPYVAADGGDQKFDHRYYVDGPITVSDACLGSCASVNNWWTVLVGTAGAGGRSVFALDVSNPAGFGPSQRLWEISDLDTSLPAAVRSNIGHVLGKPVVVPVKNISGTVTWKAIFGNGYNSASGRAVLFLVDIGTGSPNVTMIEAVETGAGVPAGTNGLGNIVVVDRWGDGGATPLSARTSDGFADTVYGADQKGAVWKFDLRNVTPTPPAAPLFVTLAHTEGSPAQTYRQPITGGLTAAAGPRGGVMLYFGTGSFSFVNDPSDTTIQSLYAVNDLGDAATVTRSNLHQQTVTTTGGVRIMTPSATRPLDERGWYVDLPPGERFVGYPRLATGTVFMPTYSPSVATGCSTDGFNWLFGLNSRTGAAALSSVRFDSMTGDPAGAGVGAVALDTGGSAPVKEVAVMVVPRIPPPGEPPPPPVGPPPTPPDPPAQGCWQLITVPGGDPMYKPYPCGRQSWRQIQQ